MMHIAGMEPKTRSSMFPRELRQRLLALKSELQSGTLPNEIYLDMCRKLISQLVPVDEIASYLTINPKLDPVLKSLPKKGDKRRSNRGLDSRRSYSKEEKLIAILLKESGRSAEEVGNLCGISRSNVEKWTSDKTKISVIDVCIELMQNGTFSTSHINFFNSDKDLQRSLIDNVISCYSSTVTALGAPVASFLMSILRDYSDTLMNTKSTLYPVLAKRRMRSENHLEGPITKQLRAMIEHAQVESELESGEFKLFDFDGEDADSLPLRDHIDPTTTTVGLDSSTSDDYTSIDTEGSTVLSVGEQQQQMMDIQNRLFWMDEEEEEVETSDN